MFGECFSIWICIPYFTQHHHRGDMLVSSLYHTQAFLTILLPGHSFHSLASAMLIIINQDFRLSLQNISSKFPVSTQSFSTLFPFILALSCLYYSNHKSQFVVPFIKRRKLYHSGASAKIQPSCTTRTNNMNTLTRSILGLSSDISNYSPTIQSVSDYSSP